MNKKNPNIDKAQLNNINDYVVFNCFDNSKHTISITTNKEIKLRMQHRLDEYTNLTKNGDTTFSIGTHMIINNHSIVINDIKITLLTDGNDIEVDVSYLGKR